MHVQSRKRRAFSLVELLCVVAVIGLAASMVAPALSDFSASSKRTRFLYEMSGLFEAARQHAVSKNTYVWLAFSEDSASLPLTATLVASKDGLSQGYGPDQANWPAQAANLDSTSSPFVMVSRPVSLGYFGVQPAQDSRFSTALTFQTSRGSQGAVSLTRSIQFSPNGEAKVGPGLQGKLLFETFATQGSMARLKDQMSDQIQVNGPTGFVTVKPEMPR